MIQTEGNWGRGRSGEEQEIQPMWGRTPNSFQNVSESLNLTVSCFLLDRQLACASLLNYLLFCNIKCNIPLQIKQRGAGNNDMQRQLGHCPVNSLSFSFIYPLSTVPLYVVYVLINCCSITAGCETNCVSGIIKISLILDLQSQIWQTCKKNMKNK